MGSIGVDVEDGLTYQERLRGEWPDRMSVFDTNILIDYVCRVHLAQAEINAYENRAISILTCMKV